MKKIFCIPFAGGTADYFNKWKQEVQSLTDQVELIPIELAGKGKRQLEGMYHTIEEAVEDVFRIICSMMEDMPYVIFGHSMGSIIAFEVCRLIEKRQVRKPQKLYCSGRVAPHITYNIRFSDLENKVLLEHVKNFKYFGADNSRLYKIMGLYINKLKNDFLLVDNYICSDRELITIPLVIFFGKDDIQDVRKVYEWNIYSTDFNVFFYSGGHFFINEHYKELINIMLDELENSCGVDAHT